MSEITEMLPFTIQISKYSGKNAYGEYTYSDPEDHKAWIEHEAKMVRDQQGSEVVSQTRIFVETEVSLKDEITLPDGRQPKIINVSQQYDFDGSLHHSEVFL